MALVLADRVRDTTTTTGTGTITLSGTAPTGYQNFSVVGNGNTTYYTINADSQWEVGIGTYTSAGTTLSRDTVLASSNSGALVNFAAGTKDVFVTYPAEKSVNYDGSNNITLTSPTTTLAAPNTSAAAWTTNGIALKQSAATFTDTTSTGTVGDVRINHFAAQTFAAANPTTVTFLNGTYFTEPIAGTNVTASNKFALGADSLRVGGSAVIVGSVSFNTAVNNITASNQTSGLITFGGASGTGTITLGQSTDTQTTNIQAGATASGKTKTINLGTAGLSGSTTAITIGSSVSGATQTTTVNGRVTLAPIGASAAAWTTNGIGLVQSAATFTDTTSTGTVANVYMNAFGAQTLAASNTITATNLYGTYFTAAAAGTNVTATAAWGLGTDSLRVAGVTTITGAANFGSIINFNTAVSNINAGNLLTTGTWTAGGTSGTGTITLGQSTASQTTNIQAGATASGNTKTINLGTGGLSGSTTAIAIGSTAGTSTTTLNGNTATPAGSTGMTRGFFYIPAAAGAPTGVPTAITGTVPMYYDTTNNKFYVYNGAWKSVTLA